MWSIVRTPIITNTIPIVFTVSILGYFLFIIVYKPIPPTNTKKNAHKVPNKKQENPLIKSATGPNGHNPIIAINKSSIPFNSTI